MLLERMVRKSLLGVAFTKEFLDRFVVAVFETEKFHHMLAGMINRAVRAELESVVIAVGENDILIIPDEGISDQDFAKLTGMIPSSRRVGIIAASGVKLLRLT